MKFQRRQRLKERQKMKMKMMREWMMRMSTWSGLQPLPIVKLEQHNLIDLEREWGKWPRWGELMKVKLSCEECQRIEE